MGEREASVSRESVANLRTALDSELAKVEELINSFKYQQVAEFERDNKSNLNQRRD